MFFGADGETRTRTAFATAPSRQRVYQFHHVGYKPPTTNFTTTLILAEFHQAQGLHLTPSLIIFSAQSLRVQREHQHHRSSQEQEHPLVLPKSPSRYPHQRASGFLSQ
jgi:hypothetical protein